MPESAVMTPSVAVQLVSSCLVQPLRVLPSKREVQLSAEAKELRVKSRVRTIFMIVEYFKYHPDNNCEIGCGLLGSSSYGKNLTTKDHQELGRGEKLVSGFGIFSKAF